MGDPRVLMRIRVPAIALLCALFLLLSSSPASATPLSKAGPCAYLGTRWKLVVGQYDANHLRVVFVVRSGDPGSVWQLFGSDNGHPFITKTKTADLNGVVRARWRPSDRAGSDQIKAAGSGSNGNICESLSITF
jgi:hypothetical protein